MIAYVQLRERDPRFDPANPVHLREDSFTTFCGINLNGDDGAFYSTGAFNDKSPEVSCDRCLVFARERARA